MVNIEQELLDENGLRHGEWIGYYSSGKIDYRWNYVHGIRHGLQERYGRNGTLWFRGYRNMGREIGYWYYYEQKKYYLWLI